jgi:outer membrane protein insertion porin family
MDAIKRRQAAVGALVLSAVLLGILSTILLDSPTDICSREFIPPDPGAGTARIYVEEVIIDGNQLISPERIKGGLKTHPGMVYNHDIVQEDVRQLIASRMFETVEVWEVSQPSGNVIVTFRLSDHQNLVRRVQFKGAKHLGDEELLLLAGVREGTPLSPVGNRMACRTIERKLQEMGRPYASCELVSGNNPEDEEVIFQITEGPKLVISSLEFTGNTFVAGAVLRTLLVPSSGFFLLLPGTFNPMIANQTFNPDRAEEYVYKLTEYYKSFGFLDVKITRELQLHPSGRDATLVFHISEGPRSDPTPAREHSKVHMGEYSDQRVSEQHACDEPASSAPATPK